MKHSDPSPAPFAASVSPWLRRNWPWLLTALAGFLAGVLWLAAIRYMTVRPDETHYHANFAVYINGARLEFKSFTFYEEVAACSDDYSNNPKARVHMHNNVNDVIHVHDKRVTYGDFFDSIDWHLGKDFLRTDDALYQTGTEKILVFELNGTRVERVDNLVIGDQDKLLVSYDAPSANFHGQYDAIENKAIDFDSKADPGSCSGLNGSGTDTFKSRLDRSFFGS
jgi:hypothetical protein